jgi:hypothetical protein
MVSLPTCPSPPLMISYLRSSFTRLIASFGLGLPISFYFWQRGGKQNPKTNVVREEHRESARGANQEYTEDDDKVRYLLKKSLNFSAAIRPPASCNTFLTINSLEEWALRVVQSPCRSSRKVFRMPTPCIHMSMSPEKAKRGRGRLRL